MLALKCIKIFNLLICAPVMNGDHNLNSKLLSFILKLQNTLTLECLDLFHKCIGITCNIILDWMLDKGNRRGGSKTLIRKQQKIQNLNDGVEL